MRWVRAITKVLTAKQSEWAYEKWCEGYTQEQIADALFVCSKTIRRAIHGRPRIRPILKYEGVINDEWQVNST